jgi:hypothetical protein
LKHSTPNIEAIVRATMAYDAAVSVDGVLLGSTAVSTVAPAGILFGVTPTTATAGGGLAAFAGDVRALTLAIEATGPLLAPVLLMSSSSRLLLDVLALGGADNVPIISSPTVPAKQLILVDAGNFASAEGDEPSIDASREVSLHEEDSTPLALVDGVQGAGVVATPMRSTFQTATIALRLLQDLSWIMTRTGRVAYVNSVSW